MVTQNCKSFQKFLIILSVRSQKFINFANKMLFISSKQTVLIKASGNNRQGRLGFNGVLMVFKRRRVLESVQYLGTVITFYLTYIHPNKEIDATKLYQLKDSRTFQDLFL